MGFLKTIRPSNFVLFAAAPFLIYLFVSSTKYARSLKAIVGVEQDASALFIGFLALTSLLIAGAIIALWLTHGRNSWLQRLATVALCANIVLAALLLLIPSVSLPFIYSLVANSVDPFTSDWIQPTVRPRQLTPETALAVGNWFQKLMLGYVAVTIAVLGVGSTAKVQGKVFIARAYLVLNVIILSYLFFVAHWGFASGIAITLRAALFAYGLAGILGLIWTGLQSLKPSRHTIALHGAISVTFLAISAYFFLQPKETYVLVGTTDARVAIIKGTPQSMADMVRFGEFDEAERETIKIRNAADVSAALNLIEQGGNVSGAFLPKSANWQKFPLIWEVEFLGDSDKKFALTFSTLGLLLLVLTVGAYQHGLHPLAVGSEFFVDTIRGIPMLVIILYIGLPLSGALKEATGGGINLTNMARGIVAIAIGYSAYMAEIFRAGIEAIPKGQVEAAHSMGMSRWKTARFVVLPQALRLVIPPLGNEFVAMIKDTSLLSILSVRDVTQRMREFQASSFLPFAPFNTAAILYVVITLCCASFLKWIERRYENKGY